MVDRAAMAGAGPDLPLAWLLEHVTEPCPSDNPEPTRIFSGSYAFIAVFAALAVIAQNEYYAMVRLVRRALLAL